MKDLLCLVYVSEKVGKKGMPIKCVSASSNKGCRCSNCLMYKKEKSKIYYDKNKEKLIIKSKVWRENNLELHKKLVNKNYAENKERISKKHKEWKENNKERSAQIIRDWKKNNLDKIRVYNHKRKAKILNNTHKDYTEKQILELYGTDCYLCGVPIDMSAPRRCGIPGWEKGFHIEHVFDIALGGPDTLENVRPAHAICNLKKKPKGMV
jgi:hypothetical protein